MVLEVVVVTGVGDVGVVGILVAALSKWLTALNFVAPASIGGGGVLVSV